MKAALTYVLFSNSQNLAHLEKSLFCFSMLMIITAAAADPYHQCPMWALLVSLLGTRKGFCSSKRFGFVVANF